MHIYFFGDANLTEGLFEGKTRGVRLIYVLADGHTHSAAECSNPHPGGQVPNERPAAELLSERLQQLHRLWGRQLD